MLTSNGTWITTAGVGAASDGVFLSAGGGGGECSARVNRAQCGRDSLSDAELQIVLGNRRQRMMLVLRLMLVTRGQSRLLSRGDTVNRNE